MSDLRTTMKKIKRTVGLALLGVLSAGPLGAAEAGAAMAMKDAGAPPDPARLGGDYRFAPDALLDIDLTSDTAWTLAADGGAPRPIKVPGGGWNSDQQSPPIQTMRDVKDYVLYERKLAMPAEAAGQAVELRFGAVNYGCEVYLDGHKAGEHHGPQVAFTIDLTAHAKAGREQTLQVKAFHRRHYNRGVVSRQGNNLLRPSAEVAVGWDYPPGGDDAASQEEAANWSGGYAGLSKVGYGIQRSLRLVVLPAVHVEETLVRTSVSNGTFACEVWVHNSGATARTVELTGSFSSWNRRDWKYPSLPSIEIVVPAGGVTKATLGPVPWELGPESYWWPNIPFDEDYLAQLHFVNLRLSEGGRLLQDYPQRFGFVEHAEGPFYYTVNGVRMTGISDGTPEGALSHFDAYGASAAFLPPTGPGTGCPESWRRYMRVGFNANRLHCSPPSSYMMAAADEVGFLLIPEAPIWGNYFSHYNPDFTPQTYHDMGRACRNHPSVARYSLANEVREKRGDQWPWRAAIDDMREVDDTRPLVFDSQAQGRTEGFKGGHAWNMQHYGQPDQQAGPKTGILGIGEYATERDGMGELVRLAIRLRLQDWAYISPWCWINYWPNFLEGMNSELHAYTKKNYGSDRQDGLDGWGSPIIESVQWALHPYLVVDRGLWELNPLIKENSKEGKVGWPYRLPLYSAASPIERSIELFNNSLSAGAFTLKWTARWDSPAGPVASQGQAGPMRIEAGHHATQTVAFEAPQPQRPERTLWLVLESFKDGRRVMHDERTRLAVTSRPLPASSATFAGLDPSEGDWQGKYGLRGHWLAGHEPKLPPEVRVEPADLGVKVWAEQTDEPRVPVGENGRRIAAAWHGEQVGGGVLLKRDYLTFTLDVGEAPSKVSLYFYLWKHKPWIGQKVLIRSLDGRLLDERRIGSSKDKTHSEGTQGYLSWNIRGRVLVEIHCRGTHDGFFSGLFVDEARSTQ